LIQEEPGFEVVGEAIEGESLMNLGEKLRPDLILVDGDLPGVPVGDLIGALHRIKSHPIVIMVSSDPGQGRMLLKAGADAFVSKGDQPDWLLESLHKYARRAKKGKRYPMCNFLDGNQVIQIERWTAK
jgi:DNA-binding NarL/FixJ family response regulator